MVLFCHPDTHYSCIIRVKSILLDCDPQNSTIIQLLYTCYATRPADPRAVFSANTVRLRAPQSSIELAVGITLAAAVKYDVQTFFHLLVLSSELRQTYLS